MESYMSHSVLTLITSQKHANHIDTPSVLHAPDGAQTKRVGRGSDLLDQPCNRGTGTVWTAFNGLLLRTSTVTSPMLDARMLG